MAPEATLAAPWVSRGHQPQLFEPAPGDVRDRRFQESRDETLQQHRGLESRLAPSNSLASTDCLRQRDLDAPKGGLEARALQTPPDLLHGGASGQACVQSAANCFRQPMPPTMCEWERPEHAIFTQTRKWRSASMRRALKCAAPPQGQLQRCRNLRAARIHALCVCACENCLRK